MLHVREAASEMESLCDKRSVFGSEFLQMLNWRTSLGHTWFVWKELSGHTGRGTGKEIGISRSQESVDKISPTEVHPREHASQRTSEVGAEAEKIMPLRYTMRKYGLGRGSVHQGISGMCGKYFRYVWWAEAGRWSPMSACPTLQLLAGNASRPGLTASSYESNETIHIFLTFLVPLRNF